MLTLIGRIIILREFVTEQMAIVRDGCVDATRQSTAKLVVRSIRARGSQLELLSSEAAPGESPEPLTCLRDLSESVERMYEREMARLADERKLKAAAARAVEKSGHGTAKAGQTGTSTEDRKRQQLARKRARSAKGCHKGLTSGGKGRQGGGKSKGKSKKG